MSINVDHELRHALNNEIHGRAGHPIEAPATVLHFAFTLSLNDADPINHLAQLCKQLGQLAPDASTLHHAISLVGGMLRYERHGEFYRLSLISDAKTNTEDPLQLVPAEWLATLPGKRLVAIETIVTKAGKKPSTSAAMAKKFGHAELAASSISQGQATIWTDFRIGPDGFTTVIVESHGMAPVRLGRVLRRINEIETYRMMALLALPLARTLQPGLVEIEAELNVLASQMMITGKSDDDTKLLARLSEAARRVEEFDSISNYRFAAARAYAALVKRRIEELSEERIPNHQRLGIFLDRRFSPAMATCMAVENRIANLAARCERAGNLLRTRVDIALEQQNQSLLASMDVRAKHQLRLQETVEGLSVVAISYYAWQLLAKFVASLFGKQAWFDSSKADLVLVPLVVCVVWFAIKRTKHRLQKDNPS